MKALLTGSRTPLTNAAISLSSAAGLAYLLPFTVGSLAFLLQIFTLPLILSLPIPLPLYLLGSIVLAYAYVSQILAGEWLSYGVVLGVYLLNYFCISLTVDVLQQKGSMAYETKLMFTSRTISVVYCFVYFFALLNLYGNVLSLKQGSPLERFIESIFFSCFIFLGNPPDENVLTASWAKLVVAAEGMIGTGIAIGLLSIYITRLSGGGRYGRG